MLKLLVSLFSFELKDKNTAFESLLFVLAVYLGFRALFLELDAGFLVDGYLSSEDVLFVMLVLTQM